MNTGAFLEKVQTYQSVGIIAFVVTVFVTPIAAMLARRFGVMDMPDQKLKPHARPTPYLGGTAICLGWVVAIVAAAIQRGVEWRLGLPILLGGVGMSIIGLADDLRDVRPRTRLVLEALIILGVLLTTGTGFPLVDSLSGPLGFHLPAPLAVGLSLIISVVLVLGACNSTNLIDGLDGLCTGVTAVISLGFFMLAAYLACFNVDQPGHPLRLTLAMSMFGAAVGFLPLNFNPARIFMGDAGSVLLGYNCGMMILLFAEWGNFRWVIGALMIFALPMFDTALAMFRRWRSGRSIFVGDRSHFYDQLVQRGLSVRTTVLICYALSLLFAVVGLLVIWARLRYAITIYVGVCAIAAYLAWFYGLTHPEKRGLDKTLSTTG
jgi:UDP-GlcNAc:undecaprenyl-phosphate GlcNAc-1-phosphate transferase